MMKYTVDLLRAKSNLKVTFPKNELQKYSVFLCNIIQYTLSFLFQNWVDVHLGAPVRLVTWIEFVS